HQGMLAEKVNDARDAKRVNVNCFHGLGAEDRVASARGARNAQALGDILLRLLLGKRQRAAAQHDALAELAKLRELEFFLEFGLAGKHNLEKFFGGGLEIGEQANLFHHRIGEVLRLVDDQNDGLAQTIALKEPVVELHELLALGFRFAGDVELRENEIKQLAGIHARVEKERGARVAVMQ